MHDLLAPAKPAVGPLLRERGQARRRWTRAVIRRWGDMHRLRLAHSLGRLPVLRGAFIVANLPAGGSRQTPMKMAHGLVNGRHCATFGSMARHISDLSDLDANWFILLGGNDGWIGSASYCDQLPLWQERRYIRMPLRPETVAREFPLVTNLSPAVPVAPEAITGAAGAAETANVTPE